MPPLVLPMEGSRGSCNSEIRNSSSVRGSSRNYALLRSKVNSYSLFTATDLVGCLFDLVTNDQVRLTLLQILSYSDRMYT